MKQSAEQRLQKPILIVGANGQVGWQLQRALAPLGAFVAVDVGECDITDPEAIRRTVDAVKPCAIVNAAAHTAVDKAESEKDLAYKINAEAVGVLAESARKHDALLVHYSTDYVYDGSGTSPWVETAPTGPLGVYGASKLAGEQAMAAAGCRGYVFRTSWVFAERGANFVKTILRLAGEKETLNVVDDQIGQPTPAALIADTTALVLAHCRRHGGGPDGVETYHLAAANPVSWHAFACAIVTTAQSLGYPLRLTPQAIAAIPGSAYPTPAKRPANSRLDCSKLEKTFGLVMPDWQPYLVRMLERLSVS